MAGSDVRNAYHPLVLREAPPSLPDVTPPAGHDTLVVYVSGPMSGYVGHNYDVFHRAAEHARALGWAVESPAEAGVVEGWAWHEYMQRDLDMLNRSHAICLLPGWEESEGATIELIAALRMGLDVFQLEGAEFTGERKASGNLNWDEGEEAEALAKQAASA